MAHRVAGDLVLADQAVLQQALDRRVVPGARDDNAGARQVDARVADMAPAGVFIPDHAHGAGGPRPAAEADPVTHRDDGVVRGLEGRLEQGTRLDTGRRRGEAPAQRIHGHLGGQRAAAVPAHAVGHDQQHAAVVCLRGSAILVLFTIAEETYLSSFEAQFDPRAFC